MNLINRLRGNKFLPLLVVFLTSFFIFRIIHTYYNQVITSLSSFTWPTIFISALMFLGYFYMRALSWHSILKALHQKPQIKFSFYNFFIGEAIRYIPGNIWSFLGRGYLTGKQGTPKEVIIISFAIEIISILGVTTLLSLPILITNLYRFQRYSFFIAAAFILLVTLGGYYFRKKLKKILYKGSFQDLIPVIFFQILAWIFLGLGTYILILQLNPSIPLLTFISIPIFAWLVGYLSVIPPMGLGVREGVLITLLSTNLNLGQATVVALLSRLILVLVEVINVTFWFYKQRNIKN